MIRVKQFYQRLVRLIRFINTGGFHQEKSFVNKILLYAMFIWPRFSTLNLISDRPFFGGLIFGSDLSNIDRSSFPSIDSFEEACIKFRQSFVTGDKLNDLTEKGWMRLEFAESVTHKYLEFFDKKFPNTKSWNSQIPNTGSKCTFPNNEFAYWSFDLQDWQHQAFREIINQSMLDEILRNRLGESYHLYSIINLISFDSKVSHSVQNFHRDHDDINSLVLFIYWTSPVGGGTEFIRGSHINAVQSENMIVDKAQGPPGSVFLMDTSGVHKGGKPQGAPRYVSWLRFSDKPVNPASFYDGQINHISEYRKILNG